MKIAVISDIHENFHNLILALEEIGKRNAEQILCLGDLINAGIAKVLAHQPIPVFMIWGNNDGEKTEITLVSKRPDSALTVGLSTYAFMVLGQQKIFISHYDDLAEPMAQSGNYNAVFYGHNHLQSKKKIGACWVVNPGELAASRTGKATFAIYDTEKNEVDIIALKNGLSPKTKLVDSYFAKHAHILGLRSKQQPK